MTTHNTSRAGRREWTAFTVLLLPLLLVNMDVSVLYFAIPALNADLEPSSAQQLWIFDIYAFVLAGLLITMGSLGDRIGPRRLLLTGAGAFGLASLMAAYATSPEMLIAARALLGLGGATLMPSTLSLIRRMFPDDRQRATAIGIWSAVMAGGVGLGSVLGGLLLEFFWWGSVFLINLPAMMLLLVVAPFLVPEFGGTRTGSFDLLSVPLSMAAVLPVTYALKELAAGDFGAPQLGALLVGLALLGAFVQRQRTHHSPMVDPALFRNRGFGPAITLNALATFAMMGSAFFTTQYLQSVLGKSALEAALWSIVPALGVGAAGPLAVQFAGRYGRRPVITAGFITAGGGFATLTQLGADSLWLVLTGAGILSAGVVVVMAQVLDLALGITPPDQAGSVSSLSETATEFGGALGMAVLGSIGTAVYRREVDAALPDGLPGGATDTAVETLGGAVHAAQETPGAAGETLLRTVREAFTTGFHAAAWIGAAVLLAAAAAAAWNLRGIPAADRPVAALEDERSPAPTP